jgi:hypothetical protein
VLLLRLRAQSKIAKSEGVLLRLLLVYVFISICFNVILGTHLRISKHLLSLSLIVREISINLYVLSAIFPIHIGRRCANGGFLAGELLISTIRL